MNPINQSHADALAEAERAGIDLSLIEVNLQLSYEERLLQHDAALELAQELRAAGRAMYRDEASTPTPPASL